MKAPVNVEGMTEEELMVIQKYYSRLGEFAKKQDSLQESHSIDEVHEEHTIKKEMEEELGEVKKAEWDFDLSKMKNAGKPNVVIFIINDKIDCRNIFCNRNTVII